MCMKLLTLVVELMTLSYSYGPPTHPRLLSMMEASNKNTQRVNSDPLYLLSKRKNKGQSTIITEKF